MRAGGRRGFRTAHCWLVRSLGYGFGFIRFLVRDPLLEQALRSKAQIVKHPDRLLDKKSRPMWDRVMEILEVCKTDHPAPSLLLNEFYE